MIFKTKAIKHGLVTISKWFSNTYNYPLIPYVKGRALGRDVFMKFADGSEALNLRLPSLDFGFVIKLKVLKRLN